MIDELNKSFINAHLNDDVNKLALSKFPDGIDKSLVVRQIQARQLLKKKLPSWSENDELLFPKRLSLEQCSSELTAKYKRLQTTDYGQQTLIDLTGGMGVDTSFLSDNFDETIYVESQEELCELARHNFKVLGKNITIVNDKAENFLLNCPEVDCIYLDPARRDEYGRKMVSLHDCSPDVAELQDLLLKKAKTVMIKLSPMLDIDIVKKELKNIKEIHVVAVRNECKELLVVISQQSTVNGQRSTDNGQQLISIDLRENWNFSFNENEEQEAIASYADEFGKYLYEPGVACMKASCFKLLSQRFNLNKLHRNSHLYTSDELAEDFPGRAFEVIAVFPFDKKTKKEISSICQQTLSLSGSKIVEQNLQPKASIAVRNFPLTADELRKQLGFKDGDDFYIFGTTIKGDKKIVIVTVKVLCDA